MASRGLEGLVNKPKSGRPLKADDEYNRVLEELETVRGKVLLSMAVFLGKTRLIDNFVMGL